MSLYNEMISDSEVTELLEIQKRLLENDNIDSTLDILMQDLMKFFNFDRVFIGMKLTSEQMCVPLIEHRKGMPANFLGDIAKLEECAKLPEIKTGKYEEAYIELADKNNYFSAEEYSKLSPVLSKLGYVSSEKGMPKESIIFYDKAEYSFSYLIMERCEEQEKPFSMIERMALTNMYNILKIRVNAKDLINRIHDETHMKDAILKNENIPVCMVDKESRKVVYYNAEYEKLVGVVKIGMQYDNIFVDNQKLNKECNPELLIDTETLVRHMNKNEENKEESIVYLIKKVMPLKLSDGTDVLMIYIKDTADYIRKLEGIDLLTSAYSLKGFFSYFENYIRGNNESDYMLCTLDISKFKFINDSKGFATGNSLLKKVAQVIDGFIRSQEVYCRMNGDKFGFLLRSDSFEEINARIKVLFDKLEVMRKEEFLDLELTYACGIVNVEPNVEINSLIDKANMSRRSAKGSRQNVIAFFDEGMERKLANEMDIESRISQAVEDSEFIPYLQPKFDLHTMKICGAEALVRWITPTGMIFPDRFIPLFEKNGFITTLDFIVYEKVMQHIRSCLDKNMTVYPISLNVSRNHIRNKDFTTQIMNLVEKYQIPIELLELEITESVFIEDREVLKFFVDTIKHIKIKVSIDDFGSAYSSLQVLKDINMDILKIDKGFIDNLGTTEEFTKDKLVLKNIVNLAKDLRCKVICEGVETEGQIEILKSIGCELGQGYVFARPMPIDEYEDKYLV